jgi:hypothetical protein
MATINATIWKKGGGGVKKVLFQLRLPCACGCDRRVLPGIKGYLIGDVTATRGVTIPIYSTATFLALEKEFGKADETLADPRTTRAR